jgi:lysozyme family protein
VEAWKVKAKFSIRTILKKNSTKIILKKKHVEKHCSKTKIMWGNIVAIHNVFFLNYEIKFSTSSI